jgi:hypothetical protein
MKLKSKSNSSTLITALCLEYGSISVPLVQRKLKVTETEAKRLVEQFLKDTT